MIKLAEKQKASIKVLTSKSAVKTNTLADNSHVQELFGILKENDRDTTGLSALLSYVKQMEDFIKSAEEQITDMRSQMAEMKEIQKHPIRTALNETAQSLDLRVTGIKAILESIKERIIEGCKNIIQAVKGTGVTALDKMADFFHIKQSFEAINKNCTESIERCDKSIATIKTFSREYHAMGLHLNNMGRMIIGRNPIETPKEMGMLAKSMCAPYNIGKKCLCGIRSAANKAVDKLEDLGRNSADIHRERQAVKMRNSPCAEHIAAYEAKAKQINTEKAAEKAGKVIDFKPKPKDEAVVI